MALCSLSIISGIYLGFSIYGIKKMITEKEDIVNSKIMTLHASTFTIYIVSTIFYVVFLWLSHIEAISQDSYLMADIFNIIC